MGKKSLKILFVLSPILFPFFAHATAYWPSGSDYSVGCGSSVVTGANVSIVPEGCSSNNISYSTTNGTTYYFVFTTNGTGNIQFQEATGNGHTVFSNPNASSTFSITSNSDGDYFQFGGGSTNWSSDMDGDLTSLCISDVSVDECNPVTPPPTPGPENFTVSTATVWALSALAIMMIIIAVYFFIFFLIWYGIGFLLLLVLRPIIRLLS